MYGRIEYGQKQKRGEPMKKKSFYAKKISFFISEETSNLLKEIPNQSQFIRDAISEKLSTVNSQNGGKYENARGSIKENS